MVVPYLNIKIFFYIFIIKHATTDPRITFVWKQQQKQNKKLKKSEKGNFLWVQKIHDLFYIDVYFLVVKIFLDFYL